MAEKETVLKSMDAERTDLTNAQEQLAKAHAEEKAKLEEKIAQVSNEFRSHRLELDRAKSTVSLREHQNRMLRMQLQQVTEELAAKEIALKASLDRQKLLNDQVSELLRELGAMQLDLTPASEPEKFYEVVQEIRDGYREHYEERLKNEEDELNQYFDYASQQIKNRDELIDELSKQVTKEHGADIERILTDEEPHVADGASDTAAQTC